MNRETQGHSYKKMKFDGEESDYSDLESLPSESESEIPSDDGIVGNDSFDFNERAKFGGTYMKRKNWNEGTAAIIKFCNSAAKPNNFSFI